MWKNKKTEGFQSECNKKRSKRSLTKVLTSMGCGILDWSLRSRKLHIFCLKSSECRQRIITVAETLLAEAGPRRRTKKTFWGVTGSVRNFKQIKEFEATILSFPLLLPLLFSFIFSHCNSLRIRLSSPRTFRLLLCIQCLSSVSASMHFFFGFFCQQWLLVICVN